jgi:hypothetical protein
MNENICIPTINVYIIFFIFLGLIIIKTHKDSLNNYKTYLENKKIVLENKDISDNNIINTLPLRQLLENRDKSILYDPLTAPERRIDINQYPTTIKNMINIPSRGYPDNYQLMGILNRETDEKILQLFGRATFPGSNQYEYYVTTEQNGFVNKIPIETRGKKEITEDEIIYIPIFDKSKGPFKINLYNYNTPRYNPYVY